MVQRHRHYQRRAWNRTLNPDTPQSVKQQLTKRAPLAAIQLADHVRYAAAVWAHLVPQLHHLGRDRPATSHDRGTRSSAQLVRELVVSREHVHELRS